MAVSTDHDDLPAAITGPIECWDDLYRLPGFQEQLPAAVMKEGIPVRPYSMSSRAGRRKCGIAECRTPHLHGYLIRVGEGLSNVGHKCAAKYFGKNQWRARIKELNQRQQEHAAKEALAQSRLAAAALAERTVICPDGYAEVAALLSLFDTLPRGLRAELMERAYPPTPRADIVQRRDPTETEIRRAKFHEQPIPRATVIKVGSISGLKAVAENSRADVVSARVTRHKTDLLALIQDDAATTEGFNYVMANLTKSVTLLNLALERARIFFSEQNVREIEKLPNGGKFREVFGGQIFGNYQGAA